MQPSAVISQIANLDTSDKHLSAHFNIFDVETRTSYTVNKFKRFKKCGSSFAKNLGNFILKIDPLR